MHRRELILGLSALSLTAPLEAQDLLRRFTEGDARDGVREALSLASRMATERLGRRDGFFGDPQVRIPLPGRIADLQGMLRGVGLSGQLDALELSLNRAAEATMPVARNIFLDAVRSMTLTDAVGIVRGGDTSATDYLRGRTERQLHDRIRPNMANAMEASGAYAALRPMERYVDRQDNAFSRFLRGNVSRESLRDSVTNSATDKALDGVFHYVGEEERAIRRDPVNRTTRLLRRVFG